MEPTWLYRFYSWMQFLSKNYEKKQSLWLDLSIFSSLEKWKEATKHFEIAS